MYTLALLPPACGVLDSHLLLDTTIPAWRNPPPGPVVCTLFVVVGNRLHFSDRFWLLWAERRRLLPTGYEVCCSSWTSTARRSNTADEGEFLLGHAILSVVRTSRPRSVRWLPPPTRRPNTFWSDLARLRMCRRLLTVTCGLCAPRSLWIYRPAEYTDRRVSTECPRNQLVGVIVAQRAFSPIPGKPFDPCSPRVSITRARADELA